MQPRRFRLHGDQTAQQARRTDERCRGDDGMDRAHAAAKGWLPRDQHLHKFPRDAAGHPVSTVARLRVDHPRFLDDTSSPRHKLSAMLGSRRNPPCRRGRRWWSGNGTQLKPLFPCFLVGRDRRRARRMAATCAEVSLAEQRIAAPRLTGAGGRDRVVSQRKLSRCSRPSAAPGCA